MEEWRQICGRNVSSLGRMRVECSGTAFYPKVDQAGYPRITIKQEGTGKTVQVHRLVARAFLGEPPFETATVDHINGIRHDNRVDNLRWATRSEQAKNRDHSMASKRNGQGRVVEANAGDGWVTFPTIVKAKAFFGIKSNDGAQRCLKGEQYSTGGVRLRYKQTDTSIDGERWSCFEGIDVSDHGRVKTVQGVPFFPSPITAGYCKHRKKLVHQLVAFAFLGPPLSPDATVDHINRIKTDNRACNLRWATRAEQSANQSHPAVCCKVRMRRVIATGADGTSVEYPSLLEAGRLTNTKRQSISRCVRGIRKHANGFKWAYAM